MVAEQFINVSLTAESSVQDHLDVLAANHIKLTHELLERLDVRDAPRQLAVVEWQAGLLTKQQGDVDLREMITFPILTVLDLTEHLRVTGNGGRIKSPVFLLDPPPSLFHEEPHPLFFRDLPESSLLRCEGISFPKGWMCSRCQWENLLNALFSSRIR